MIIDIDIIIGMSIAIIIHLIILLIFNKEVEVGICRLCEQEVEVDENQATQDEQACLDITKIKSS